MPEYVRNDGYTLYAAPGSDLEKMLLADPDWPTDEPEAVSDPEPDAEPESEQDEDADADEDE